MNYSTTYTPKTVVVCLVCALLQCSLIAQSPFTSNKQGILFSNAQSGASERWISLFAPASLSANYRLIFPTAAPSAGQLLNVASISGSDYTLQWADGVTGSGAATQVAFWNGVTSLTGSSNLYWDNTNRRLGIGTSSPSVALAIINDGGGSGVVDDAGIYSFGTSRNPSFIVASARGTAASPANLQNGDMMGSFSFYARANGATVGALTELQAYYKGDGTTNLSNLAFLTGSTQRAMLDEFGNFGVGTSSPLARLHTFGSGSYAGLIMETGNNGIITQKFIESSGLTAPGIELRYDGTPNQLEINDNSTSANIATFMRTGNVGIGTNVPTQLLHTMNGNVVIDNNDNTARELRFKEPSSSGTNYTAFKATTQAANVTYTLPNADGVDGANLQTDGSGNLSWSKVGTVKYARKLANENVTSSTTLQDDDHLTLSLGANEVWECEIFFRVVVTSNTNGGVKMKLNFPAGTSVMMQSQAWIGYDASTGYIGQDFITGSYNFYYTNLKTDANGGNVIRLHGMINVGATAGNIQWQFTQQTSSTVTTTGAVDSYMKLTRIQ